MVKKKIDWVEFINMFVLASLLVAIPIIASIMILAPSGMSPEYPSKRLKSDYVLMFLECIVGVFAILLPKFLKEKINVKIPSTMMLFYTIFLYCAIYLGEVRSFYSYVTHWDTILHTFSGGMLGTFGFSIVTILNKSEKVPINLSPVFVALFAFCFAVTLGVMWEFYEFSTDGILHTNMQKFALENGELLIGRMALKDTVKDLIVDSIGAFVSSTVGYLSLRYKKGWIEKTLVGTNQ